MVNDGGRRTAGDVFVLRDRSMMVMGYGIDGWIRRQKNLANFRRGADCMRLHATSL